MMVLESLVAGGITWVWIQDLKMLISLTPCSRCSGSTLIPRFLSELLVMYSQRHARYRISRSDLPSSPVPWA
jgi:hypothetical protein